MKIKTISKHAPLTEWEDDEDELSPAERALIAKADTELKAKGVKVKDFDADKMVGNNSNKSKDDEETSEKPAKKSTEKASVERDPSLPAAAKGDKAVAGRKFLQDNPDARRRDFVAFMAKHGAGAAYSNTMFYALKKKVNEVFFITNDKDEVLAEGDVWTVFEDYKKKLQMFKSEWTARSKVFKTGGKVGRFTTESENLYELSPSLLAAYKEKAQSQGTKAAGIAQHDAIKGGPKEKQYSNLADKRFAGVKKAEAKLK